MNNNRNVVPKSPSSSNANTARRLAAGTAVGVTGATAAKNRIENKPSGYGSVSQSNPTRQQIITDPAARRSASQRLANDPRARQNTINQLQTDPAARAAARAATTGVSSTRAQAHTSLNASGVATKTTLPAHTRPVRINHHNRHHRYRYHRPYRTYYWTGRWWYRPYYYGGYVYYEEIPAPVGGEIDELPEDEFEIVVIDGKEYYKYNGAFYVKSDSGFEVVDPYADPELAENEDVQPLDIENSQALKVLDKMSKYTESIKGLYLSTEETHDNISETGERYQLNNTRRIFATKPNMIRTLTNGDGINQQFWYNKNKVTIYSEALKSYSTVDAPDTLPEMVSAMSSKYGLSFPLADIMLSDIYYALSSGVLSAEYVGQHRVANATCDHLAFSQESIDWQLWVEASTTPILRKIQISYKLEPGIPIYTMEVVSWAAISEKSGAYDFVPPKDAVEIEMKPL